MSDYQSNVDLVTAASLFGRARRVLLTTHGKPDGDAMGSVIALAWALREVGKQVEAWVSPPVPAAFNHLRGREIVRVHQATSDIAEPDIVVVLDTGAWAQLEPMRACLTGLLGRMLIVDHHLSGDVPALYRYIDGAAAATAHVVADLIEQLWPSEPSKNPLFTPIVCEALYVGIASDTGWFRFSNTSSRVHRLAARLLDAGVDHAHIYSMLEQTERPQKLALLTRALNSLRLLADGRVAMMVLHHDDFAQTGAFIEETERLVDIPQVIGIVKVVVLVTEPPANNNEPAPIRLSFRSKPGDRAVNVAKLAQRFGGGGHARAAGAKLDVSLEKAVQEVSRVLESVVTELGV